MLYYFSYALFLPLMIISSPAARYELMRQRLLHAHTNFIAFPATIYKTSKI